MEQEFAHPLASVRETGDDRIWILAFGELRPLAVVRFGDEAVVVGIVGGPPDRADPVEVAELLLDAYGS